VSDIDNGYLINIGLTPGALAHDALIALLVHLIFVDGEAQPDEVKMVGRLLPDRDLRALKEWMVRIVSQPLDVASVGSALVTVESQWYALRFSAHVAVRRGQISDAAHAMLTELLAATRLPETALDKVLGELLAQGSDVGVGRVIESVAAMNWGEMSLISAAKSDGDLFEHAPSGSVPMYSLILDGGEVVSIFQQGIAGVFEEGIAFLAWQNIDRYTRVPTLSAQLVIQTADGRTLTLRDPRYAAVATLLDKLFVPRPDPAATRPEIEVMQAY
jgi:hypothetical protein